MPKYDNYSPEILYPEEKPVDAADAQPLKGQGKKRKSKSKENPRNARKEKPASSEPSLWRRIVDAVKSPAARILLGIFVGCLAVYLGVAFLSYFTDCIKDQSVINSTPIGRSGPVSNAGGEGGARLSEFLINECFGLGSIVIVVWLAAISMKLLVGKPRFKTLDFTIKCFVALITVSLIIGLVAVGQHSDVNWGGYHGTYVNEFIIHFVGWTGAILLSLFMVAVFVVICMRDFILWIMRMKHKRDERRRIAREEREKEEARQAEIRRMQSQEHIDDIQAGETTVIETDRDIHDAHDIVAFPDDTPIYDIPDLDESEEEHPLATRPSEPSEPSESSEPASELEPTLLAKSAGEEPSEPASELEPTLLAKSAGEDPASESEPTGEEPSSSKPMEVYQNTIGQTEAKHFKSEVELYESHHYKFPPYDLLLPAKEQVSVNADEQLENKRKIEATLLNFNIPITKITATVGPTVTLYEIVPDKGVTISKIRSRVDDIALSLSAIGVRIIAPIPGKGTVGIEVANKEPQTVSMQTVIRSNRFQENHYRLPIAIGSTISNEVYIADLAKMPHLLVAGATGQGKSVGLNAIIASLLYCKAPHELKFVMIDPKQVEFSFYNQLKDHYMAMIPSDNPEEEPVITDMERVQATLNSLCVEMDQRYSLLKAAGTRNIEEYNAKIRDGKLNPAEGHRFLPYIVVVVDEFGDLIMVLGKSVEMPIARLAQKARAVGMHVIIATQRPSTDVITGIIKANFPARMSFKVSSGIDSRTILDSTGAEYLIGRGDMLIFHNSEMTRVQCAFIDTPEVERICEYVERQPYPTGPYELPEPQIEGEGDKVSAESLGSRDPLFEEIARGVVTQGSASTSSLQRTYSIGFARAGRIMDQLQAAGIVGPGQGGKPRTVLVDPIGLDTLLESLG